MLMVRPVIKMNYWRRRKSHIMIFFIFLISNIGGGNIAFGVLLYKDVCEFNYSKYCLTVFSSSSPLSCWPMIVCKIQCKMHRVDEPASYTYVICVDLQGHEKDGNHLIWNYELNEEEIRREMYSVNTDNRDGLVAYYAFNGADPFPAYHL